MSWKTFAVSIAVGGKNISQHINGSRGDKYDSLYQLTPKKSVRFTALGSHISCEIYLAIGMNELLEVEHRLMRLINQSMRGIF